MEKDFPVRRVRAFTLLELLVVLAVTAVVLGLAIPAWGRFLADVRVQTATAEFVSALHMARSESIKRGFRVTLCKSATGAACTTTGGWEQGWIIFVDSDSYGSVESAEAVIRVSTGQHDGLEIWGNTEFARLISYTPIGTTRTVSGALGIGSFWVCSEREGVVGRRILISSTGRARIERTACE